MTVMDGGDGWMDAEIDGGICAGGAEIDSLLSWGRMNKQAQGKDGGRGEGGRCRNQAIKERGSERGKDEWALNESIMINQDASLSLCLPFSCSLSVSLSLSLAWSWMSITASSSSSLRPSCE